MFFLQPFCCCNLPVATRNSIVTSHIDDGMEPPHQLQRGNLEVYSPYERAVRNASDPGGKKAVGKARGSSRLRSDAEYLVVLYGGLATKEQYTHPVQNVGEEFILSCTTVDVLVGSLGIPPDCPHLRPRPWTPSFAHGACRSRQPDHGTFSTLSRQIPNCPKGSLQLQLCSDPKRQNCCLTTLAPARRGGGWCTAGSSPMDLPLGN